VIIDVLNNYFPLFSCILIHRSEEVEGPNPVRSTRIHTFRGLFIKVSLSRGSMADRDSFIIPINMCSLHTKVIFCND
jgi:hypothetical protein